MSELIGWEIAYKLFEPQVQKKEDIIVLLTHFVLTKSGYRCLGLGDHKALTGNEATSEILPSEWSSANNGNYSIRYSFHKELFILRGVVSGDSILLNFLQVSSMVVSSVAFNAALEVESTRGNLNEILPSYKKIINRIRMELLQPHGNPEVKEMSTQTTGVSTSLSQRYQNPDIPAAIPRTPGVERFWEDPSRDPLRVGQRDLDPLNRGGGMIFNPFQPHGGGIPDPGVGIPGNIPPGSVPPGARFDPIGPPGFPNRPGPRRPPDNDGFGGMFM